MTDERTNTTGTPGSEAQDSGTQGNEAERMREGYAHQQERDRQEGKTSAGGAGSTGTPGNSPTGGETTSDRDDG